MLKNLLLTLIRHFRKNLLYSLTILFSLGIAFAIVNLMITFLIYELNTDTFHKNRNRIYRLVSDDPFGDRGRITYIKRESLDYISEKYPEIESSVLVNTFRNNGLARPGDIEKFSDLTLLAIDSTFFDLFEFPVLHGSLEITGKNNSIILTSKISRLLFGTENPVGQSLTVYVKNEKNPLTITGVLDESYYNSHLKFDALIYVDNTDKLTGGVGYFLVHPQASINTLEGKINTDKSTPDLLGKGNVDYFLQPLEKVYFDEFNTRSFSIARNSLFIWISGTVILLILVLAGFNFINLFYISFVKRWKEFGLKKILGASKSSFILSAATEIIVFLAISYLLSLFFSWIILPHFQDLIGTDFTIHNYVNSSVLIASLSILFIIAVLVILRITLSLEKIRPVQLISNKAPLKIRFNRFMTGIQFLISIILITCTLIIFKQAEYIQQKPLGYNRNIFEIRCPENSTDAEIIKNAMLSLPGIRNVSVCSGNPISDNMIARYDLEDGSFYTPYIYHGDADYIRTLGLTLLDGLIPSPETPSGHLVNEAFVSYFDMENPLGEIIPGTKDQYISGIVQNFNVASLKTEIPPVILSVSKKSSNIIASIDDTKLSDIISGVGEIWKQYYPEYPYRYLLLNDELLNKHHDDIIFAKIIFSSSIISILITAFGLFALSWALVVDRSKEMGIRRVIGATGLQIFMLQIRPVLMYAGVSMILSIPISWLLSNKWLEMFTFKISITPDIFGLTMIFVLIIILITTGYQSLRASRVNPVEELKYE